MPRWVESWEVESRSTPGEYYVVSIDEDGNFGCSCPGWKFHRRGDCKHIRLMKGQLRLERQGVSAPTTSDDIYRLRGEYGPPVAPSRVAKSALVIHEAETKKRRRYVLD